MFLKLVVEKFPIVTNFHDVIKTVVSRPQIHCVFHNLLCLNLVFPSSRRFYLSLDTIDS